ncbi:gamma-glutamyl-gamma-aminobutyrate hydrolase family protein [Patescibacteria group bacterium]|nr:gamma-glutamyl-gamma-aminobutyrate hydrolase family protein [Patescibacteria group bacterium]
MNILLIDNGTSRLTKLYDLLKGNKTTTIEFGKINSINIENFDLIILSGSKHISVIGNEHLYKNEIDIIKNTNKPIIGICLGFELIGYAYGVELLKMEKKEKGIIKLLVSEPNSIFSGLPNFQVYEAHRWVIKKTPDDFIELARSKDGVEAIKHKSRKLYGFQFHPEMFVEKTCGDEIFKNTLEVLNKN